MPQRVVVCTSCQQKQTAPLHGLSLFCKNCNRRIDLGNQGSAPTMEAPRASLRTICCPGCQASHQVPSNALSAFCHKCGRRINMQNYTIRGKFNGDIQTKGTLTVALGGDIRADVHVGSTVVEGQIYGTIWADEKVEIRSTGTVQGDIYAKYLVVHDGAILRGNCKTPHSGQ